VNLDLALVDFWASSGRSVWHRTSAIAKLFLLATVVGASISSSSLAFLSGLYAFAALLVVTARLPLLPSLALSAYPTLFSLLFVASRWDGTWTTPLVFFLRALTGGLVAVWLVGSTPYPDLFAPVSRVVPRLVGDALFLSYRAFFTLVRKLVHLAVALRLRGGVGRGGTMRTLANVGQGLGTLVLFSAERSRRVYAVMALRGHSGRVCGCRHWAATSRVDWLPLALGTVVVVAALWAQSAPW
jgi:energy-coupling factor transporter transmembrane protein EcfT